MTRSLIYSKDQGTRKAIERTFRTICTHKLKSDRESTGISAPKVYILKILLKNLPQPNLPQTVPCEEYFNLITSIIRASSEILTIEGN